MKLRQSRSACFKNTKWAQRELAKKQVGSGHYGDWRTLVLINNIKRICPLVFFAVPENGNIRMQKYKQILVFYQRVFKNQCEMTLTLIPLIAGALEQVTQSLERKLIKLQVSWRMGAIQNSELLKFARIFRRDLKGDVAGESSQRVK